MDYRVIKENELFLLTDASGDIPQDSAEGFGLYTRDTRFLSRMELLINGRKPIVLSSEADQNFLSQIVLTNPHIEEDGKLVLWRESVEIERTRFIYEGILYESVKVTNYNPHPERFELAFRFDADFCDMFIVRGFQNGNVGRKTGIVQKKTGIVIGYAGADGIERATKIVWSEQPSAVDDEGTIFYRLSLGARDAKTFHFYIIPIVGGDEPRIYPHDQAVERLKDSYVCWVDRSTRVQSDLPVFDEMYRRGLLDIRVLLTDLGYGPFPVAGLPWFAVPFGRDSLITALQLLHVQPEVAKGTIRTMARFQGEKVDPWRDEQPGKVMHELRSGELANSGQIPFTPYYGTIDATPLFLVLLGEYVKWTDDMELLEEMIPHVERAMEWIDRYGDRDGDGLVEYYQESSKGIANQGWKDSGNSVVHRNGELAEAPIALVEVQGYVYHAKTVLAGLLRRLAENRGRPKLEEWASRLEQEAEQLRKRFEDCFWMEQEQFYALALDSGKRQVAAVTSNPGHLLLSGLPRSERAAAVARRLTAADLFSGYGIRTMSDQEIAYNPMSYHNGSVWPHDNSLILMGLNAYGFREEANLVIEGLLRAVPHFENCRLPELFCGYPADQGRPVRYPVACSPQAWAAGTPLVFVLSFLGLALDFANREVRLRPSLPAGMNELRVSRLRLGWGVLDVAVRCEDHGYRVDIVENSTGWRVVTEAADANAAGAGQCPG